MDKNGIEYNIVKTYKNGVRVGNVPNHWKDNSKRKGIGQSWFPKSWGQKDVVKAAEHVLGLKHNSHASDGKKLYGKYKGVWVVVIKTNGTVGSVFPNSNQSELYFEESNIEEFVKRLETLYPETEYVNRLMTHSWGQKAVRFYDPDGNLIEVGTPV